LSLGLQILACYKPARLDEVLKLIVLLLLKLAVLLWLPQLILSTEYLAFKNTSL
jgi:hypothetical protein